MVVQTYADVVTTFQRHPEAKYADVNGEQCTPLTVGALHRRHTRPHSISYIGKEADKIDEAAAGLVSDIGDVVTRYEAIDQFRDLVLSAVAHLTAREVADRVLALDPSLSHSGAERAVERARNGTLPRAQLRQAITDSALLEAAQRHRRYRNRPLALLREQQHLVFTGSEQRRS